MKQQVNLYTPELHPRKQWLDASTLLLLLLLEILSIGVYQGVGYWQRQQLEKQVAVVARQTDQLLAANEAMAKEIAARKPDPELEKALERVTSTLARREQLLQRVEALASHNQSGFSSRMAALARQVPGELWLTGIRLESSPARVQLTGRTRLPERVPIYLENLGAEPIFAGHSFQAFELKKPEETEAQPVDWVAFRIATEPGEEAVDD